MVEVLITGRHVVVPEELRTYITSKAEKLERFYDRIHEVEVVLDQESDLYTTEMIVRADHKHTFVAKETGPDPTGLVDAVVDKLERQLTRHKEKNRNRKHDGKAGGEIETSSEP